MPKSERRIQLEQLLAGQARGANWYIKTGYVFDVLEEMLRSKKDEAVDQAIALIRDDEERATFILELARYYLKQKEMALALRRIHEKIRNYDPRLLE